MISMTTALIFAGGKSTRMGEDKSQMFGGVSRLIKQCQLSSVTRIIIMCGDKSRMEMFDGEVWPDPEFCTSLVELVAWSIKQIDDDMMLIPCDAFNLQSTGIDALIQQGNCVPVDQQQQRQPLMARITDKSLINWTGETINQLFSGFSNYQNSDLASQFANFNQNSDLSSRQ